MSRCLHTSVAFHVARLCPTCTRQSRLHVSPSKSCATSLGSGHTARRSQRRTRVCPPRRRRAFEGPFDSRALYHPYLAARTTRAATSRPPPLHTEYTIPLHSTPCCDALAHTSPYVPILCSFQIALQMCHPRCACLGTYRLPARSPSCFLLGSDSENSRRYKPPPPSRAGSPRFIFYDIPS